MMIKLSPKKTLGLIFLSSIAGAAAYSLGKAVKADFCRMHQICDCKQAIFQTLCYLEVTDFESFSAQLLEYYGITAKKINEDTVEYSSDKYKSAITSDDIAEECLCGGLGFNMKDLDMFFLLNRHLAKEKN